MISPAELEALMKSDTPHAVLDLRERGAYQKRHIFRATSLPRRLLEQRLPLLVPALPTPDRHLRRHGRALRARRSHASRDGLS